MGRIGGRVGWLQWGIKRTDIFRGDKEMLNMFLHHLIVPTVEVGEYISLLFIY
jgi:hypothetical protein